MAGALGTAVSFLEQKFATLPVSVVGQGIALYALSIRYPGASAAPVPGQTYIFPMSPQAVKKETSQLTMLYDVQGQYTTHGVQRLADMWGESPPMFVIRGTTGWKRHSSDAFALTGKQSIAAVQVIFDTFASFNQQLMSQGATDFYTLEFFDYFLNEFWQIVPVGPQGIDQTADKPLISTYTFRFAAIASVSSPLLVAVVDALVIAFSAGAQQIQIANSYLTQTLAKY